MPLKLGSLALKTKVIQSPMASCTDLAFRMIGREFGMEFAFLEMISAHALVQDNGKTLSKMKSTPEDRPLGAQLVGCEPRIMGEAAAIVERMGFDLLDLNLGCPVPKVTGGGDGAGSALLQHPKKAKEIFESVAKHVKNIPLSVKMRLGFRDASGKEACEIARIAQGAGFIAVAVHGRTREQKYSGEADYEGIGRVKKAVKIPVIGNGDIRTGADAVRMVEISGCDGVMLGRGALGNPWIYEEIAAALRGEEVFPRRVPFEERRKVLLKHLDYEIRFEGEWKALRNMRRIAGWYIAGIPGAAAFRRTVCTAETTAEMRERIIAFRPLVLAAA